MAQPDLFPCATSSCGCRTLHPSNRNSGACWGPRFRVVFAGCAIPEACNSLYNAARVTALSQSSAPVLWAGRPSFHHNYRRKPLLRTARSRDVFLECLEQTRRQCPFDVIGFVVMPEHVHLLLSEPENATCRVPHPRAAFARGWDSMKIELRMPCRAI